METLDILHDKFPDDKDLFYSKSRVEMSINYSPRLVVEKFHRNILPYEDQIKANDEHFFIGMSKTDSTFSAFSLHEKWSEFSEDEKEKLFLAVNKLVKMCKLAIKS